MAFLTCSQCGNEFHHMPADNRGRKPSYCRPCNNQRALDSYRDRMAPPDQFAGPPLPWRADKIKPHKGGQVLKRVTIESGGW